MAWALPHTLIHKITHVHLTPTSDVCLFLQIISLYEASYSSEVLWASGRNRVKPGYLRPMLPPYSTTAGNACFSPLKVQLPSSGFFSIFMFL